MREPSARPLAAIDRLCRWANPSRHEPGRRPSALHALLALILLVGLYLAPWA